MFDWMHPFPFIHNLNEFHESLGKEPKGNRRLTSFFSFLGLAAVSNILSQQRSTSTAALKIN